MRGLTSSDAAPDPLSAQVASMNTAADGDGARFANRIVADLNLFPAALMADRTLPDRIADAMSLLHKSNIRRFLTGTASTVPCR